MRFRRPAPRGLKAPRPPRFRIETRAIPLRLARAWTIARGTSTAKSNILVRLHCDGHTGLGEAAPSARFDENADTVRRAIGRLAPIVASGCRDLLQAITRTDRAAAAKTPGPDRAWRDLFDRLDRSAGADRSALAAVDLAIHDWIGRRQGKPVFRMLGADPARMPPTSFSIGIDTIPVMQEKAREAEAFPILKIKLGGRDDRAIIEGIRAVTDQPLFVDANEAWTDRRRAVETIRWLRDRGVVLVEQPLPAADRDGAKYVRDRVDLPIFADEAVRTIDDIAGLAGAYDGINIKLQKAGGLRMARFMVDEARRRGLKILIGCMIETAIGITAAAHLAPLADHADLDGNLLLALDPYRGARVEGGRLVLTEAPGLGVEPAGQPFRGRRSGRRRP